MNTKQQNTKKVKIYKYIIPKYTNYIINYITNSLRFILRHKVKINTKKKNIQKAKILIYNIKKYQF